MSVLDREIRTYDRLKESLQKCFDGNEVVLIKGRHCYGIYPSRMAAYRVGLGLFGNVPMLIRSVDTRDERPVCIPTVWISPRAI